NCEVLDCAVASAQFDLALNTLECDDGRVIGYLDYATDLFEPRTIARFCGHFLRLLELFSERPEALLGEVDLLSEAERGWLAAWSRPEPAAVDARPISALIAAQARQRPGAIALVHRGERLTFAELEARANRLAHRLIHLGVGPE